MKFHLITLGLLCLLLVLEVSCDSKGGTKGGSSGKEFLLLLISFVSY